MFVARILAVTALLFGSIQHLQAQPASASKYGAKTAFNPYDENPAKPAMRLQDPDTKKLTKEQRAKPGFLPDDVVAMEYSPDSKYIVAASKSGWLRYWEVDTGKLVWKFDFKKELHDVAIAPDGKLIAVCSDRPEIFLLRTNKELKATLRGHTHPVTEIAFSPDGHTLASRGKDQTLRLWSLKSGQQLYSVVDSNSNVVNAQPGQVPQPGRYGRGLAFSADGKKIITNNSVAGNTSKTIIRDAVTGKVLKEIPTTGACPKDVAVSPDGRTMVIGEGTTFGILCEMVTGEVRGVLPGEGGAAYYPYYGQFGQLSGQFGSLGGISGGFGGFGGGIAGIGGQPNFGNGFGSGFQNVGFGSIQGNFNQFGQIGGFQPNPNGSIYHAFAIPRGHTNVINHIVYSPDGEYIVTAGNDSRVLIWNSLTTKVVTHVGEKGFLGTTCIAYAPNGKTIATAVSPGVITVWNTAGIFSNAKQIARMAELWQHMADPNALVAFQAMQEFAKSPKKSLAYLHKQLRPANISSKLVQKLIADLESDNYGERVKAEVQLGSMVDDVKPALEQALEKPKSLEMHLRLKKLLRKLPKDAPSPVRLQQMRAVELLERVGGAEARQLLQNLAGGTPEAWLTCQAKDALKRMAE